MAETDQTRVELKGLLLAVIAGVLVVALAFGVSAVMRHVMAPPVASISAPVAPTSTTSNTTYTAQMITDGAKYYGQDCASCHGTSAMGSVGPNLHHLRMSDDRIARTIKNGKGSMPAFGSQFNDTQIQNLVGYLRSLK